MQVIAGTDLSRRRQGPFLSPFEIVALAGIVAALLYLVFPGRDFENPQHLTRADDLSMAYLRMLLRAHPDDGDARLLLVQQQVALGRLEEATETLEPLRGRGDALGEKAEVVALKLDRIRLYAIPPEDPARLEMQGKVAGAALRLLPRTSRVDDLAELADFILALGKPAEAARAYERLAKLDAPNRIAWLEKAGRWFHADGQPAEAARVYSEGALGSSGRQGARLGQQALVALLAANQGRAGVALAKPIVDRYPQDLALLEQAVQMAVAAGDLSTARRWGEQRVVAAGNSPEALREQIDILTKAGDPVGALRVARTLLARNGNDAGLRKQVAMLARWSGEPEESLANWAWLARRGSEPARATALDLAEKLADVEVQVEMLEMRARQAKRMSAPRVPELEALRKQKVRQPRVGPLHMVARRRPLAWPSSSTRRVAQAARPAATTPAPSVPGPLASTPTGAAQAKPEKAAPKRAGDFDLTELISLADALEAKGLPARAIKQMDDFRFNFAERPEYWVRIATLYEHAGELEQALACLEQLARLKAMTLDDSIRQAKLLWRLARPEAALTRLVALRGQARETETEYWRLVGALAWRLENDLLSVEAYSIMWKNQKTADVAEPLFRALDGVGRSDEAINIAEEAYEKLNLASFLVAAVDIAVRQGQLDRAKQLFSKARGKEKQFELETHFWFQRAQLAFGDDRPAEAERDLMRVLEIDPGNEDAHVQWLTLAVHMQDTGMATRALQHWGQSAESDIESWGLLSDAFTLLGDEAKATRFRRMAREERRRQRLAAGRPMTPEEHMEEAVERRDRRALETGLTLYAGNLSLPIRVAALRELGRETAAWDLINQAGLVHGDRKNISSEDALALSADIRDLRESYLDGVWVTGGVRTLGDLEERYAGARFELRLGHFFLGASAEWSQLLAPRRAVLIARGDQEKRAYFIGRLQESFGSTTLRAGVEFLSDGDRPQIELIQQLSLFGNRLEGNLRGVYGQVPTGSSLLRMGALRDGLDFDVFAAVSGAFELGASGSAGQYVTRLNEPITTELSGRTEIAFRLPIRNFYVRPRIDAFANLVPPLKNTEIPGYIRPLRTRRENANDVLALEYRSVGLGLSMASTLAAVGEARGPHVSARFSLDAWAGYMFPSMPPDPEGYLEDSQPAYALDAELGLVFARHQELSITGFYYSDFRQLIGENFWGGTVNYTVRWFR